MYGFTITSTMRCLPDASSTSHMAAGDLVRLHGRQPNSTRKVTVPRHAAGFISTQHAVPCRCGHASRHALLSVVLAGIVIEPVVRRCACGQILLSE